MRGALARGLGSRFRRLPAQRFLAALLEAQIGHETVTAAAEGPPAKGAATPTQLWKYESPLLRHLSTKAIRASSAQQAGEVDALDALPAYEELKQRAHVAKASPEQQLELLPGELEHFWKLLRNFQHSAAVKDQALGLYVNAKLFRVAIQQFQEFLLAGMVPELRDTLGTLRPGPASADALFPYFAQFVLDNYMEDIRAYRTIVKTADLRKPHQWFPVARSLTRRIIYHSGPTNSGKTYNALLAMKGASSGVYCGPLRLLAMEVYDNCNADGTYCNLITGQERREVPGATHTSCTVEMVNMQRRVDVAVIDEIQMIGDESRGWAWTRALMGAPANEVHVCGDGSAVGLVKNICEEMGESFELRSYERFTSLEVESGGLGQGGYADVQPGDCVVAFSRKDIYAIKQYIERETQHRACVVYGGLPPETRRTQARLFNDADTRYKVLVASDAVGMGLNLNIRRIIFHSMHKFDGGRHKVPVSVSMVKQIAGRAGRRSSQWAQGLATCRDPRDVARLQAALQVPLKQLSTPTAGLFPEFEHLEVFAGQHPDEPFRRLLTMFGENALLDSTYFFCKQDSVLGAAQLLDQVPLSLKDMYNFCMAPASAADLRLAAALLHFATKYARGAPVELAVDVPRRIPANVEELKHMEAAHQVAMLWLWLSYRFEEESFPGRERAERTAAAFCELLDKGLERVTRNCKRGVDVSLEPARPIMEGVLDCFSDEHSQLMEARKNEQDAGRQRRSRRVAERLAAAQLALELASSGREGAAWGALTPSSGGRGGGLPLVTEGLLGRAGLGGGGSGGRGASEGEESGEEEEARALGGSSRGTKLYVPAGTPLGERAESQQQQQPKEEGAAAKPGLLGLLRKVFSKRKAAPDAQPSPAGAPAPRQQQQAAELAELQPPEQEGGSSGAASAAAAQDGAPKAQGQRGSKARAQVPRGGRPPKEAPEGVGAGEAVRRRRQEFKKRRRAEGKGEGKELVLQGVVGGSPPRPPAQSALSSQ